MSGHDELLDLSLSEAAEKLASQQVSPVELIDATLERINVTNDELRAFITVYEEEAREVARAHETLSTAGHRLGPLHGIPVALKDNIGLQGLRTTAGQSGPSWHEQPPSWAWWRGRTGQPARA